MSAAAGRGRPKMDKCGSVVFNGAAMKLARSGRTG